MAKLTKAIQVRFSPSELAALDAYCAEGRRVTGEPFHRTEVIRLAIARLVASAPKVHPPPIHTPKPEPIVSKLDLPVYRP